MYEVQLVNSNSQVMITNTIDDITYFIPYANLRHHFSQVSKDIMDRAVDILLGTDKLLIDTTHDKIYREKSKEVNPVVKELGEFLTPTENDSVDIGRRWSQVTVEADRQVLTK